MAEMRWTSGPWEVSPLDDTFVLANRSPDSSLPIAEMYVDRVGRTEAVANARLIASSPDLYDALAKAAATFRHYEALHRAKHPEEGEAKARANEALAIACEAVLAKARGEQ